MALCAKSYIQSELRTYMHISVRCAGAHVQKCEYMPLWFKGNETMFLAFWSMALRWTNKFEEKILRPVNICVPLVQRHSTGVRTVPVCVQYGDTVRGFIQFRDTVRGTTVGGDSTRIQYGGRPVMYLLHGTASTGPRWLWLKSSSVIPFCAGSGGC